MRKRRNGINISKCDRSHDDLNRNHSSDQSRMTFLRPLEVCESAAIVRSFSELLNPGFEVEVECNDYFRTIE